MPGVFNPPPVIPDYELLRLVGSGSYGDVWLARSLTGHYRAAKIVWRARFTESEPFEREFKGVREFAAVSLTEPHQLALLHVGRNNEAGFFYYIMELADDVQTGTAIDPAHYTPHTLRETRARQGRMPALQVISLGVGLARALAGLHARGLVHRDVKPSNVIFVGGIPKLADIGLVSAATDAQTFLGTEGFVPPEGTGAPAADVFGLGKLLYEMATGMDRHDYPRLPADLGELADRSELLELNEILLQACVPNAGERYPDATALLDDLLVLQAGRSMRRLHATERRLARGLRAAMAVAIVMLVMAGGALLERERAHQERKLRLVAEAERNELLQQANHAMTLAAARRALDLGDPATARRELGKIIPASGARDFRDHEWHELWGKAKIVLSGN